MRWFYHCVVPPCEKIAHSTPLLIMEFVVPFNKKPYTSESHWWYPLIEGDIVTVKSLQSELFLISRKLPELN